MSRRQALIDAAWTIGISLGAVALALGLRQRWGDVEWTDTILYAGFSFATLVPMYREGRRRGRSRLACWATVGFLAVAVSAIFIVTAWITSRT